MKLLDDFFYLILIHTFFLRRPPEADFCQVNFLFLTQKLLPSTLQEQVRRDQATAQRILQYYRIPLVSYSVKYPET